MTTCNEASHALRCPVTQQVQAAGSKQRPPDVWQERFQGAHNATNYPRWVAAAEMYAINGSAISRCHSRAARSCAQLSDSTWQHLEPHVDMHAPNAVGNRRTITSKCCSPAAADFTSHG